MSCLSSSINWIKEYEKQIETGEAVVGDWIRRLYQLINDGLKSGEFKYSQQKADKAIFFVEKLCHHSKGRNDLIKLEPWQKSTISLIFGIVDKNGHRQFREIVIVMARKNGKTLFAAALAAYAAYLDGEYGAEIYCIAPKLEQADVAYSAIEQIIKKEPELKGLCKKTRAGLYIESTNTWIKKIAFNAKQSDGFNPHLTICDEIHAWPGDRGLKQYEAMRSGLGARCQPMIISISTAGYEVNGIYDELLSRSTRVLLGDSEEKRLLPILYMVDDVDKWEDINELKKASPNLGVSFTQEYLEDYIRVARQSKSSRVEFITKYCNIQQNSSVAMLDFPVVDKATEKDFELKDFAGYYGVGGIDLSQTIDLTAASMVVERDGELYVFCQFFMPEGRVAAGTEDDGVPYQLMVDQGLLTVSGDHHVNYRDVYDWFVTMVEVHNIRPLKIGYDRYSAHYLIDDLTAYGFHCDDVHQGENLMPVIKEFEGMIRDGRLHIGKNVLLKAHFLNVALKHNLELRRFRPVKISSRARIDGFVSVIDALTVRQKYYLEYEYLFSNEGR